MKQVDTLQKEKKWLPDSSRRWYLWYMILLAVLTGTGSIYAQDKISWNTYSLAEEPLSTLSETVLTLDITPAETVSNASVTVQLPTGITYKANSATTAGHNLAGSFTASFNQSTNTVTLSYNKDLSARAHVELTVYATCEAVNGSIQVSVLSGSTSVSTKSIDYTVRTPVIKGTTTINNGSGLLEKDKTGDIGAFNLQLNTSNGSVAGATITLTYKSGLVLSNFTFVGETITPIVGETSTTITLPESTPLNGTAKVLTFDAMSNRCGVYTITASASFACATYTDEITNLTLAYPTETGTPAMTFASNGYLNASLSTPLNVNRVPMDGKTISYYWVNYKNEGNADGYDISAKFTGFRNKVGKYNYVAVDDASSAIMYSVDGGITIKKLTSASYTLSDKLESDDWRTLRADIGNMYSTVNVNIPDPVAKGQNLIIYYPVAGGAIYDNSGMTTPTIQTLTITGINAYVTEVLSANNACGEGGAVQEGSLKDGFFYPRITGTVPSVSIAGDGTGTGEATFSFYTGTNNTNRNFDIVVDLPDWLELDGATPADAIKFDGTTSANSGTKGTGNNPYVRFSNTESNGTVTVKYKTTNLGSYTGNQTENIRIWIDWNMNEAGSGTTLEYFTQVFQEVTLLMDREGIFLDEFYLFRDSRGKKDIDETDGNQIPDDGVTDARDGDINHSIYLKNDKGQMVFKAHVPDTEGSNTYKHMYLLVSAPDLNMNGTNLAFSAGTLTRNGGTAETVSLTRQSDTQYYLKYTPSSVLEKDDELVIEIPFKVGTTVTEGLKSVTTECYVTDQIPLDVFNPSDRYGKDLLSLSFGSYDESFSFGHRGWNSTFGNNDETEYYLTRLHGLSNTALPFPYFGNEFRNTVTFKQFKVEMPMGYYIPSGILELRCDGRNSVYPTLISGPTTDASGVTTYTYDLTSVFDKDYTDANPIADRWPLTDEYFRFVAFANVQATKFAEVNSNIKTTVTYDNLVTGATNLPQVFYSRVSYTGTRIYLSTNGATSVDAISSKLTISPVTIGNPNTTAINDVYLYIGGEVNDVRLTETDGTVLASGTGADSRWLKVADVLEAGYNHNYNITFAYTGSTAGDIEIYIVSGFDKSWNDTDKIPSELDRDNVSRAVKVSVQEVSSRVDGSISVDNYTLEYDIAYTVTASVNSESSAAPLKNPKISLLIPANQLYEAGSAKIEYPKGTIEAVSSTVEDALIALGQPSVDTNFVIDLAVALGKLGDFTMPGFMETSDTDKQVASFTAKFAPQCDSQLDGMRYYGTLGGSTSLGGSNAFGTGRTVMSRQLLPNVISPYHFNFATSFATNNVGGRTAFNENITSNTLYIDITKVGADVLNTNNHLRVEVPDMFTVGNKGDNISISGDLLSTDKTVTITDVQVGQNNNRVYYIKLPATDYDDASENGNGSTLRFAIPLTYTSAESHKNNPVQIFSISVVTLIKFGTCLNSYYAPIGQSAECNVAVVRTSQALYNLEIDKSTSLEVVSDNFTGTWYKSDQSSVLSTSNPMSLTPTIVDWALGSHTLYVSANFSGVDYGMVPVLIEVFPSPEYIPVELDAITTPVNIEGTTGSLTVNVTAGAKDINGNYNYTLYRENVQEGSTIASNASSHTFALTETPATDVAYSSYTYHVTVQGTTNCGATTSNQVVVNVYPEPVLTVSGLPVSYCETDATLQAGIYLLDYVNNADETRFTYAYSTDGGSNWSSLTAGGMTVSATAGTYTYLLKAVNKLSGSTLYDQKSVNITIQKKTSISSVSGQEVTEGQAINIVVVADGEGPLQYTFEEFTSGSWTTVSTGTANTYQITPSASISADNGKQYRVTVTGSGSCSEAISTFSVKVNSATAPPLGNNKVTWDVIGYGNVSVTADGISINNGSHVNNGTTLVITGTTWKTNVLQSITVNGTEYSSSPVSYTVNGGDVHIVVEFLGSDPNPDPNSNAEIESGSRIWTEGGYACIYTETTNRSRIVTFNGRVVTDQKLSQGESRIQLPDGYYIVTLSDGTTAKIAVRNF